MRTGTILIKINAAGTTMKGEGYGSPPLRLLTIMTLSRRIILTSALILLFCPVLDVSAEETERLSFVGMDGLVRDFNYMDAVSEAGGNFYGIEQLRWYFIEPGPPTDGKHHYRWERLDEVIRKIEGLKGRTLITIISASTWATKQKKKSRVASPPEDDHWDDYRAFVKALVERYDRDGYQDMPGLKYPHLYYQIEDEAENLSSWNGSADEYLRLLRTAYEGAKSANPSAKILTFSPNFGDEFDYLTPEECERKIAGFLAAKGRIGPRAERKLRFVRTVLEARDAYDIIAVQYNYHYTGLYGTINLVRRFSDKPVWVADAASSTLLGRHRRAKAEFDRNIYPHLTEKEIASILADRGHPRHGEIKDWWEAEKSRTTFKKIVTAASLNAGHIFMQFIRDARSGAKRRDTAGINPWNFTGLLDDGGEARPVVYTIKLFHEKLGSFTGVEDMSRRDGPFLQWIFHYRFKTHGGTFDVLWTDGDEKRYRLDVKARRLVINRIIEEKGGWPPEAESTEDLDILIGRTPVIVGYEEGPL